MEDGYFRTPLKVIVASVRQRDKGTTDLELDTGGKRRDAAYWVRSEIAVGVASAGDVRALKSNPSRDMMSNK